MKRLLFTLVIVMAYGISNAQLFKVFGHEVGSIYVGPRLGMNFSKFSDFNGTYEKSRFGYEFGAVGEFGFTTRFSIQTELMFLSKGSRDENFGKIRMNYIGIPILAKYGFRALGLDKVYVMGGTFANVRVGGAWVYDDGTTYELGGGMKKFEWGMGLGAGAQYPFKTGVAASDLRYSLGFSDIHSDDNITTHSRSFEVILTYKFDLVDLMFKLKKNKTPEPEPAGNEVDSNNAKGLKIEKRN